MDAEQTKVYELLKRIPEPLFGVNEIPVFGYPPPFPWEEIAQKFAAKFEIDNFKFKASKFSLRDKEQLLAKLGTPLTYFVFSLYPLEESLYFVLPRDSLSEIMARLIFKDPKKRGLINAEYEEAFRHFMAAAFIQTFNETQFDPAIQPVMREEADLPKENMLTSDITISFGKKRFIGRCYISETLQKSVREHYKNNQQDPLQSAVAEKLTLRVHLEGGKTTMTQEQWSKVKPGDFIILDQCSLKPGADKGRVFLTVKGMPLFRGKIKEGNLTILEYPV